MLIDKRAASIAVACSTEETRQALCGVHVRKDGTLEATNGHMLLRVAPPEWPSSELPGHWPNDPMTDKVLAADSVRAVAKALPKKSNLPILLCAAIGPNGGPDTAKAVVNIAEDEQTIGMRLMPGTFPETDQVMPKGDPIVRVQLSAAYLKDLASCADRWNGIGGTVTFTIYSPETAVGVECSGERPITGLLMPMRLAD